MLTEYKAIFYKTWDINCNSFFINFTTNWSFLSNTMLSDNIYNFHMLFLNNLTNPFANILSIVVIKYVIFNNLSHITKIVFFSTTNSNFMIKSTIIYIYSFSSILLLWYTWTFIFYFDFILFLRWWKSIWYNVTYLEYYKRDWKNNIKIYIYSIFTSWYIYGILIVDILSYTFWYLCFWDK